MKPQIEEEQLNLSPPIHIWASKTCPHCGEVRNLTGFIEGLWESNNNDEVRYYLFHEPYQFLLNYWHQKDIAHVYQLDEVGRKEYLALFEPGEMLQVWGDGHGGWSKEYLELFGALDG